MEKKSSKTPAQLESRPRIEALSVKNYRALRDLTLSSVRDLTVLLGHNGSGKSTIFDVFAFLSECFQDGLRRAWERRGRAKELKSRNGTGPVEIEIKYREGTSQPLITYHLEIDEDTGAPIVVREFLKWRRGVAHGQPFRFLDFHRGAGTAIPGDEPDDKAKREETQLSQPDLLAVNALGQLKRHPRVEALRSFITDWHVSYLNTADARGIPEAGPEPRLSQTGDNLANVLQYLQERHIEILKTIFERLGQRVPHLAEVRAEPMADGRLLLKFRDEPFSEPIQARFASDGTLKMLAYLVLLHGPNPPRFVGLEEPENYLFPKLLQELAEECVGASERSQVLVTTHSPFFVDGISIEDIRILRRNELGHTEVIVPMEVTHTRDLISKGGKLGDLWMEGFFDPPTVVPGKRSGGRRR